jgi:adenylate cyclase
VAPTGSSSDQPVACPTPEEIRGQLERILDNPAFEASERRRQFLGYIVEEALAGRSHRLKGYAIATAVFGRDETFDSQTDPVVRLEAGRLRRDLEHYYLTSGRSDPVRIEIPKGGYVPAFHRQAVGVSEPIAPPTPAPQTQGPTPPPKRRLPSARILLIAAVATIAVGWLGAVWFGGQPGPGDSEPRTAAPLESRPSVLVAPFANLGNRAKDSFAEGVGLELVSSLVRFKDLVVFDGRVSFRPATESLLDLAGRLGVDYLVTGSVRHDAGQIRITTELVKLSTGATIWASSYDGELGVDRLFAIQDTIANNVAAAIAQPYGVVYRDMRTKLGRQPPQNLGAYECLLQAYDYRRDFRPETHAKVRACLEQAVEREPGYAEALAMLSTIYLDEFRWRFNPRPDSDPLAEAVQMAERAVESAPESAEAWTALFEATFFRSDLDRAFAAGDRAIELNPSNPELLALVGLRRALAGQWEQGLALVDKALTMNPTPPPWYYFAMSVNAFRQGDDDEALRWAEGIDLPGVFWTYVLRATIYGQLGRRDDAAQAVARLLELYPDFEQRALIELSRHHLQPVVFRRIVEGLRKAGLEIPETGAAVSAG